MHCSIDKYVLAIRMFSVKRVNGISGQVIQFSGQVIFGKMTSPGQVTFKNIFLGLFSM